MENTSGMKDATLPPEIKGLNWGGLLLSFIWAIGHGAWLWVILSFVPVVNVIVPFYLLFKGNEIAWRNKKWESAEAFKKSQRTWAIAGLVIIGLVVVINIIVAVTAGGGGDSGALLRLLM